ncbi:hypothetical protein ACIQU6_30295 [Streptomyces sp. NPDC090442]|jgi:putative protein-disulfide isomerase|uniref:hypothetical protein n=1 Tax=Streptomyces sp. NPDC090442 TaxID=3365962 RepID=UPI0037F1BF5F
MDSRDAATGLAALRTQAPHKALDFAHEMSHAVYHNDMSLTDPSTATTLAARHDLAPETAATLDDPAHRRQAEADFARARGLGRNPGAGLAGSGAGAQRGLRRLR